MTEDRRKGDKPIPEHVRDYLNDAQIAELHKIESFGWELKFIRHPLFMETVAVVASPEGNSIGILEKDGRLSLDANIPLRHE